MLGFVGLVFLCYFGSDKLDKYREAWGEGLVFWGVSGSRCTGCYPDCLWGSCDITRELVWLALWLR